MIKVFSENDDTKVQSYIKKLEQYGIEVLNDHTIEACNREVTSIDLRDDVDIKQIAIILEKPIIFLPRTKYDDATIFIWDSDENILIDCINNN